MMSKLRSVITNPTETASNFSSTISNTINDNYPNFSKRVTDNYSSISSKFTDNYSNLSNKFNESYPTLSSGLTSTRFTITSTFNSGSTYIYQLPSSVSGKVFSYANFSILQPVDADEREITRTPPNENLDKGVIALKSQREEIINNILDLYSLKPSKEVFKHYDNDVVFQDTLIYATGLADLKASFYGMPKLFAKSTTLSYKILENTPNVLRFDVNQRYTLPYIGRAFVQNCQIVLELVGEPENQKIVKHTDLWSGKPIVFENILIFRKGIAKLVSTLIRVPES